MDSSSIPSPPKLQMAQVLADLNPPLAALSFLRTLSTIPANSHERKTSIHITPPQKFDRLGRRISQTPKPSSGSQSSSSSPSPPPPPLRKHSYILSDDLPETEESKMIGREMRLLRRISNGQDPEFKRAKKILIYYKNLDRLEKNCTRGLRISQERVDKALTEQAERRLKERGRGSGGRLGESHAGSYF
ncbi:hypothetical protein NHQ30_010660 [Ciborinia camelliae]|nr:hypothetical protein NHQ30_010660 [Ciborinia camelliae]